MFPILLKITKNFNLLKYFLYFNFIYAIFSLTDYESRFF